MIPSIVKNERMADTTNIYYFNGARERFRITMTNGDVWEVGIYCPGGATDYKYIQRVSGPQLFIKYTGDPKTYLDGYYLAIQKQKRIDRGGNKIKCYQIEWEPDSLIKQVRNDLIESIRKLTKKPIMMSQGAVIRYCGLKCAGVIFGMKPHNLSINVKAGKYVDVPRDVRRTIRALLLYHDLC